MPLATTIDHHHDASTATGIPNEKLFMIARLLLEWHRTAKAGRPYRPIASCYCENWFYSRARFGTHLWR
jgi:hypothetical protein